MWLAMTTTSRKESSLQRRCLVWVKARPDIWCVKIQGGGSQDAGVPDVLLCIRGLFVAVEFKRPDGKGRLSDIQRVQIERIRKAGGVAVVIDNYEDFVKLIEGL